MTALRYELYINHLT
jgi:hypothetical protein